MSHQRKRGDRSLLDGGSGTRDSGSGETTGVWDADSFGSSASETADHDSSSIEVEEPESGVRVDRDKLTDRQLEVLETAHDMGYYQYPRGANASEVAEALDICPSTLAEHLAAAQSKLLEDVLDDA